MVKVKLPKASRNHRPEVSVVTRLDLGSGPNGKPGFTHVDAIAFPGVDIVTDLRDKWPWEDDSVDEVHASHFVEHLWHTPDRPERVHFANELWRVLKMGAKATIICPHWSSCRAYGDFTHAPNPVSEFWLFYLKREWREVNAPHNDIKWNPKGYKCSFDATWGYSLEPATSQRNQEYQQFAMTYYVEARQDIIATLVKC